MAFVSQTGDPAGQGQSTRFTVADSTITVTGTSAALHVAVTQGDVQWHVDVAPGVGDTLHPGTYSGAERYPFQTGRSPGLAAYGGGGHPCGWLSGSFVVDQIAFDSAGQVSLADVTLVQHCEDAAPALTVTVHDRALPLSFQATLPFRGAVSKTYTNGTSLLSAQPKIGGPAGALHVRVSGLGDIWDLDIAPPTGASFAIGRTYHTTGGVPDATHAELRVVDGTGCAANPGSLRVDRLTVQRSVVVALALTFSARCYADQPTAVGTLHYFA